MATNLVLGSCSLKACRPLLASISRAKEVGFRSGRSLKQKACSSKVALQRRRPTVVSATMHMEPLDLTEENVEKVLGDARVELGQLFDESVGMTGQAELAELDGPFVKIRLRGRFWHKRSTVLARLQNYLKQRIPEILEVDIEDHNQLDDSPANF